jgi:hypothetical protein
MSEAAGNASGVSEDHGGQAGQAEQPRSDIDIRLLLDEAH